MPYISEVHVRFLLLHSWPASGSIRFVLVSTANLFRASSRYEHEVNMVFIDWSATARLVADVRLHPGSV